MTECVNDDNGTSETSEYECVRVTREDLCMTDASHLDWGRLRAVVWVRNTRCSGRWHHHVVRDSVLNYSTNTSRTFSYNREKA